MHLLFPGGLCSRSCSPRMTPPLSWPMEQMFTWTTTTPSLPQCQARSQPIHTYSKHSEMDGLNFITLFSCLFLCSDSKAHNYSSRSLQQALNVLSAAELPPYLSDATVSDLRSLTDFQTLGASGGNLLSGGLRNVQVRSQFHNGSCLVIWMSDHFKDGWDRAVLTVRAPDLTNDTFHPHCDQVEFSVLVTF